jgi:hypothetical protein
MDGSSDLCSGPTLQVNFPHLQVDTLAAACTEVQYSLHFARVRIIASRHPTSALEWTPVTSRSAESTFTVTAGKNSSRTLGLTFSNNPSLSVGFSKDRSLQTEEVRFRSKVACFLNAPSAPGERIAQWHYNIDDPDERSLGGIFRNPPQITMGFKMFRRPHLEVEVLTYWTTLAGDSTKRSTFPLVFPWSDKRKPPLVFTNFINHVSVAAALVKLKGRCRIEAPQAAVTTTRPLLSDVQCMTTDKEQALDSYNRPIDLKVMFGCALYGRLDGQTAKETTSKSSVVPVLLGGDPECGTQLADAPPPLPLLRSLSQTDDALEVSNTIGGDLSSGAANIEMDQERA